MSADLNESFGTGSLIIQQSNFIVVEVTTTTPTIALIQYLIVKGFDEFAVVSDLSDHPSLNYKVTSYIGSSTHNQRRTREWGDSQVLPPALLQKEMEAGEVDQRDFHDIVEQILVIASGKSFLLGEWQ
ncbi:hypothetical protein Aduo_018058 [Ancylostoma duodenale]